MDLTFTATDLKLRQPDGNFKVTLDGIVVGDQLVGSVEGKKVTQGYRIKVNLEKGNRKTLQADIKARVDPAKMQYSAKIDYSLIGGVIRGTAKMKFENKEFNFANVNKETKEKIELRVFLNPGDRFDPQLPVHPLQIHGPTLPLRCLQCEEE